MKNTLQTYIFSVKMADYFIIPAELQEIAFNALKLDNFVGKYLALSKKQIRQARLAFLKYSLQKLKQLGQINKAVQGNKTFYTFFKDMEVFLDKNDKLQRLLFVANACFYFLSAAQTYDDINFYFVEHIDDECPEVQKMTTRPIEKYTDSSKLPKLETSLFSFTHSSESIAREHKYKPISYQLLGWVENAEVLLDQKYGHTYLLPHSVNTAEKISDLIFVNSSLQFFVQILKKIKQWDEKIRNQNDFLKKAAYFLQLKKEIWLIDKTIGIRTETSLWKDIFFAELDQLHNQMIAKHLAQRQAQAQPKPSFSLRLSNPDAQF